MKLRKISKQVKCIQKGCIYYQYNVQAMWVSWLLFLLNPFNKANLYFLCSQQRISGIGSLLYFYGKLISKNTPEFSIITQIHQPGVANASFPEPPAKRKLTLGSFKRMLYLSQSEGAWMESQPLLLPFFSRQYFTSPTAKNRWRQSPYSLIGKNLLGKQLFPKTPQDRACVAKDKAPLQLLFVAGSNWQFLQPVLEKLKSDPHYQIRTFEWDSFIGGVEEQLFEILTRTDYTPELIWDVVNSKCPFFKAWFDEADTIFVEWAKLPAVWLSILAAHHGKRLIVRLHSVEAFDYMPYLIQWNVVSDFITVCAHTYRALDYQLSLSKDAPEMNHRVIYNLNKLASYELPKYGGAAKTLGLIGYNNANKDPLMALEILGQLVAQDSDWRLLLVGHAFGEGVGAATYENIQCAKQFYKTLKRLKLQGHVEFRSHTQDLPLIFQEIGTVLSCSLREGTHETVIQGMASGAIPLVRRWPLVEQFNAAAVQYPNALLYLEAEEAAQQILSLAKDPEQWRLKSLQAKAEAFERFDEKNVWPRWEALLNTVSVQAAISTR
jgi:glycosyltransferase involved in cell wall biosynthesis